METKQRIIITRVDGVPVNLRFEPVKSLSQAARFHDIDEYESFMNGYYKPDKPELYKPGKLRITYELESEEDGPTGNHAEATGTISAG